jgi:hypothetical protein
MGLYSTYEVFSDSAKGGVMTFHDVMIVYLT